MNHPLNALQFIANASGEIENYKHLIANADTYSRAKEKAAFALGYIECMITFLNTAIHRDNNNFTGELSDVIDNWMASIYQSLANKAIATEQDNDIVLELLKRRDYHLAD